MSNRHWGWTEDEEMWIPDLKITEKNPKHWYQALRGNGANLAVFSEQEDRCIGWIDTRTLGFENALFWLKRQ